MTTASTTQVHQIYIKAKPEAIWDAITKPEWTERYGYGGGVEFDLRPGGAYRNTASDDMKKAGAEMGFPVPDVVVDGEVVEANPPHKLVITWRLLMDPGMAAEGFSRLTYEITESDSGYSRLTLIHDLDGMPNLAAMVAGQGEAKPSEGGGGWPWVLSDLKSLLETGTALAG
jgi:uncharacterized protein YndB with AHSA1/START domain